MHKEDPKIDFAHRLKSLRMQKALSQSDVADKIGIHKINYGRYERGESKPTTDTLSKLSDVFGVSTDFLLEGLETDAVVADIADRDLVAMFAKIETLSDKDKEVVKTLIDAFLKKKEIENTLAS